MAADRLAEALTTGLSSEFVVTSWRMQAGHLWIGSHAGIVRVAKSELELYARHDVAAVNCLVLDDSDGLSSLEIAGGNQPSACTTPGGNGLRNMRERLEQLGGRCEISSAPGKGASVSFQVPVRGEAMSRGRRGLGRPLGFYRCSPFGL